MNKKFLIKFHYFELPFFVFTKTGELHQVPKTELISF